MQANASPLELWGGHECTVNRVGDRYFDQTVRTGHHDRLSDLTRFAEIGFSALRYPVLWERIAPNDPATRDWAWEFPGGRVSPGEDPEETARHELEEEIGAVNPVMTSLGSVFPYPAFSSSRIHLFAAIIDQIGNPQRAEGIVSIERVSPARLLSMVHSGEIMDAAAIACILKAQLARLIIP